MFIYKSKKSCLLLMIFTLIIISSCFTIPKKTIIKKKKTINSSSITITAMGDLALNFMMMKETLKKIAKQKGWDYAYNYPFSLIKNEFKGIIFGNLEAPITIYPVTSYGDKNEIFYFKADPGTEKILKMAGFNLITLANNHMMDCTIKGMFNTKQNLEDIEIKTAGIGNNLQKALQPVILQRKGLKIAVFAFNKSYPLSVWAKVNKPGTAGASDSVLVEAVRQGRALADIIIVSIHWGKEKKTDYPIDLPSPYQKQLAKRFIDNGASALFGHHSHAVGKVETYKNGIIFYSLGDTIFSGRHSSHHKHSYFARVKLSTRGLSSFSIIPINIDPRKNRYRPWILDKQKGMKMIKEVLSKKDPRFINYYK